MEIYIFKAENLANTYGYSTSEDGSNLPHELDTRSVTWAFNKKIEVEENDTRPYIALNIVECLNSIKTQGWYINQISINFEIK